MKLFPCCYALQRPIAALRALDVDPEQVARVVVRTPQSALAPLIHAAPTTGLEGKFSLQYAVAATLLDGRPGIESFTDEAVARPAAQALLARVEVDAAPGGDWLLAGDVGDRADARRRLDAARPARPAARRARPPAVARRSWPRRWPTARATSPTRSSRSTGSTPARSCVPAARAHPLRQPRVAHHQPVVVELELGREVAVERDVAHHAGAHVLVALG